MDIIKILHNLTVKQSIAFMTISVAILSIVIPIINSRLNKIDINTIESQGHMIQAEIRNFQSQYFVNFANYLITIEGFEQSKKLKELWKMCWTEANRNLRFRLALLHVGIHDKYPDKSLLDKWSSMNFEQLNDELNKPETIKKGWRESARKKIFWLNLAKNILYGTALALYIFGSLGLNVKQ